MKSFNKYLPIALFIAFLLFGISAFIQSKPSSKNARIYKTVQKYSPYYLEKRFGGLEIRNKEKPDFKEKPNNATLFKTFEHLEREWGKRHLSIKKNQLVITDNNGSVQLSFPLQSKDEVEFLHRYYGI